MPDLTPQIFAVCPTTESFAVLIPSSSEADKFYRPALRRVAEGTDDEGWRCEDLATGEPCKGFQFRRRCRHVEAGKRRWCGWSQFIDGGYPQEVMLTNGDTIKICPKCLIREVIYEEQAV